MTSTYIVSIQAYCAPIKSGYIATTVNSNMLHLDAMSNIDPFCFINIDYRLLFSIFPLRHRQYSATRSTQADLEVIPNHSYRLKGSDVLSTTDYDVVSSNEVDGTIFQKVISPKATSSGHYYCKGKQIKNLFKYGNSKSCLIYISRAFSPKRPLIFKQGINADVDNTF